MPRFLLPLSLALALAAVPAARAAEPACFDDAALHAVQMVDDKEGWAVGDEGVVWHTLDGGKTWERQPTGVRASLRSVCFLNSFAGWVAGRQELPHGGGSAGVLLFTRDGGCTWKRVLEGALPGLNRVRFCDARTGFLLGDGSDRWPTGVFKTEDGGRTWKPVPGAQCPGWLDGDFTDGRTGALAGAWSRLATLRPDGFVAADVDSLGGRSIRGLRLLAGGRALAVGEGGLVLFSRSQGKRWGFVDLKLPPEALAGWDFHALDAVGDQVWAVGRPGSVLLHSADAGATWNVLKTGHPLPLHGVYFLDKQRGWAVGELGSILRSDDGGATWKVQRRGGQRAALLFVHARPAALPVETLALVGGEEGYLAAGLCVTGPDPKSAAPGQAGCGPRFAAAVRAAGGAAGEGLWQFPLPQHLADAERRTVLQTWDEAQGGKAADELLRQLVLALRTWRPDVVVTDHPDPASGGAGALVAEAVHLAFGQAADPQAFPEQITHLGLEPWRASRAFALWDRRQGAQVSVDATPVCGRLKAAPRDYAAAAAGFLFAAPPALPAERFYRLLDGEQPASGRSLVEGLPVPAEGVARRSLPAQREMTAEEEKAMRARRTLQTLAEGAAGRLADPGALLAQAGPVLDRLPPDQGAAAAFALASQYARAGNWPLAQEAFLLMAERYPADPLTADAYRWLIRYNSSGEARRRHELGQFVRQEGRSFRPPQGAAPGAFPAAGPATQPGIFAVRVPGPSDEGQKPAPAAARENDRPLPRFGGRGPAPEKTEEVIQTSLLVRQSDPLEVREWCKGSLEVARRLQGLGPLFGADPSIQFCLQSARRQTGDAQAALEWYKHFQASDASPAWRALAAGEVWLAGRQGMPPRPVLGCRRTDTRPFLDGGFDDPCWRGAHAVVLQNAVRDTLKDYRTEVRMAHDREYLYVAVRCTHPPGQHVPPAKERPRDADLRPYDRVSILLDVDRDYSTYYRLEVDQRGCAREDCWGDRGWDPKWFVAVRSGPTSWQVEAAIPMAELTGQPVGVGTAWAFNVVRTLPGRGVQAWSLPADVEPRPEGMGLLIFETDRQ